MQRKQCGFTLIELMVGMVIGMAVVLAMGQVMSVNEGYKRTTMFGNDSMVNGALALNMIERDGKNAGYGFTSISNLIGCEVKMKNGSNSTETFILSGVQITDGASGAPDTLRFTFSNKNGFSLPTQVTVDHPRTAANFFVDSDAGIDEGDLMIAVPENCDNNNWASLFAVTGTGGSNNNNSGQGQNQVLHNSGQSVWNQAGGQSIFPNTGYPAGSYLINLGSFGDHTYSIANNSLQLRDSTTTQNLFPQIIQLQAQYGKDTNNDQVVDTWDTTAPADWLQVKVIRVALVSRSVQWQKEDITTNDVTWAGGVIFDENTNPGDDWRRYRYQVFETVIPLRNLIWQQNS